LAEKTYLEGTEFHFFGFGLASISSSEFQILHKHYLKTTSNWTVIYFFIVVLLPGLTRMPEKVLENPNPIVHQIATIERKQGIFDDEDAREDIDNLEIFDLIRNINDPEHPLTLEQLNVTQLQNIKVRDIENQIDMNFTTTIPHCSMATLIGLCIRVKLLRSLPSRFKINIKVTPGTHASEDAVNKQLNDKERVAAALENGSLLEVVNNCLKVKPQPQS